MTATGEAFKNRRPPPMRNLIPLPFPPLPRGRQQPEEAHRPRPETGGSEIGDPNSRVGAWFQALSLPGDIAREFDKGSERGRWVSPARAVQA